MDKKKWPWKRRSTERSPGESESPGSLSSHSERYSDEQDASRESPNDSTRSPEITSKASTINDEVNESMKSLTEKLSAALVNVSAKEDLVKQHAKVAEEAVAGWEKAENEVASLKQQLEVAVQQNVNLEVRVSHLDGALKECVRQLRQAKEERGKRIEDAIEEKNREWESAKAELKKQIVELKVEAEAAKAENSASASIDHKSLLILQKLEKENSLLKQELASRYKELEIMIIERELSTQAAESASKLQLESIKKVAKLEAECRRLQAIARKSSPVNNSKSVAASCFYAESLTDSHSDSGERPNVVETNGSEPSCSDSWASALIAELDHFKNDKPLAKGRAACSFEIDMMDDFLEMERLAALPETKSYTPFTESASGESVSMDNPLRAELDSMSQRVAELEKMLEKLEAEKIELETALDESRASLEAAEGRTAEAEAELDKLQKELTAVNEAKDALEFQLVSMEVEARTMSANADSLKAEIEKERTLSAELTEKCQELENELKRRPQETEIQRKMNSNGEQKLKEEDIAVAANKLAECQKTIASLGMQLKSLATLEDFLIDTSKIPGFSKSPLVSDTGSEIWKLHSNDTFSDSDPSRASTDKGTCLENGNGEESPTPSSLTTSSANQVTAAKNKNGFGKFFSRSKGVLELNNRQE